MALFDGIPPGIRSVGQPYTSAWLNKGRGLLGVFNDDAAVHTHTQLSMVDSYVGDGGAAARNITLGVTPGVVFIVGTGHPTVWKHQGMGATGDYWTLAGQARGATGPAVGADLDLTSTGIRIGSGADTYINENGTRYFVLAYVRSSTGTAGGDFTITYPAAAAKGNSILDSWSDTVNAAFTDLQTAYQDHRHSVQTNDTDGRPITYIGTYTGAGASQVDVTDPGFSPSIIWVQKITSGGAPVIVSPRISYFTTYGSGAIYGASVGNVTKTSSGFTIPAGPNTYNNESGETYAYLCMYDEESTAGTDYLSDIPVPDMVYTGKDWANVTQWLTMRARLISHENAGRNHYHSMGKPNSGGVHWRAKADTTSTAGWSHVNDHTGSAGFPPSWFWLNPQNQHVNQRPGIAVSYGGNSLAQQAHDGTAAVVTVTFDSEGFTIGSGSDWAFTYVTGYNILVQCAR